MMGHTFREDFHMRILGSIFTIVLTVSSALLGQPLADKVPAEAIVYVGWRGTNDLGPDYAGSRTEAIIRNSAIAKLLDETLPQLTDFLAQQEPDAAEGVNLVATLSRTALQYPAAGFAVPDPAGKKQPRGAFVLQPGKDRDAVLKQLNDLKEKAPDAKNQPRIEAVGDDLVVIAFNYPADAPLLAADAGKSIQSKDTFKTASANASKAPVYFVYADVSQALALIEKQIRPGSRDAENQKKALKLLEELGLKGIESFSASAGFVGRDFQTDVFVGSKAPHKGLLAQLQGKPFDADLLKRVPVQANYVQAYRFDPVKALEEVQRATSAVDPAWRKQLDDGLQEISKGIDKDIVKDVLEPLGDEWIIYASRDVGGTGFLGTTIVNKLDDAAKAKETIIALTGMAEEMGKPLVQQAGMKLEFKKIDVNGQDVYYLAMPVIAPAWTIRDGYLYLGLYPQTVVGAATYDGKSIVENPLFAESSKQVSQANPISFTYVDTAATIDDGYNFVQLILRTYQGLADMFVTTTPEMLLPPLSVLQKQATPVNAAAWMDDSGFHYRSISPFPLAETLASGSLISLYTNNAPFLVPMMVMGLSEAREEASRVQSSSNLRQVGLACKMFANENQKLAYPDDFEDLIRTQDITADVFINPRLGNKVLPELPDGAEPAKFFGDWVEKNSDYAYVGKGLTDDAPADKILAYEKPAGLEDGINILFVDGHVEFVRYEDLAEVFNAAGIKPPVVP